MKSLCLTLLLGVVGSVTHASAAPILYNINFSGGTPNPTSGSFKFDPLAANPFSEFFVVWNSFTFDFTVEANKPNVGQSLFAPCDTSSSNPIDRFNGLNGACGNRAWTGVTLDGISSFEFKVTQPGFLVIADTVNAPSRVDVLTSGVFDIASSEVPEPSTYALLLSGGALMLATGRRIRDWQGKGTNKR